MNNNYYYELVEVEMIDGKIVSKTIPVKTFNFNEVYGRGCALSDRRAKEPRFEGWFFAHEEKEYRISNMLFHAINFDGETEHQHMIYMTREEANNE